MVFVGFLFFGLGCSTEETIDTSENVSEAPYFSQLDEDGYLVEAVVPQKYLGLWYEYATIPSGVQANCTATTAEYTLLEDNRIEVYNRCNLNDVDGQLSEITGTARAVDERYNHLKVNFFGNFEADYYIVALDGAAEIRDTEYQWAVVSSFQDRVLWVLTRSPDFSEEDYKLILEDLERRNFDLSSLKKTPHKD